MIVSEFEKWLNYLTARFPDTAAWLQRLPADSRGPGDPSHDDVLSSWADLLKDTTLSDARAAVDKIFAGDEDEPRTPQAWARQVRRLAFAIRRSRPRNRRKIIDGQETYDCPLCQDSGTVVVYTKTTIDNFLHGRLVRGTRMTNETPPRFGLREGTVPCACAVGGRNWMIKEMGAASYDERFMCQRTVVLAELQYDEIAAWVEKYSVPAGTTPF